MDHKHFSAQVPEINQTQLTTISLFPLTGMSWVPQVFGVSLVVTHHCKKNILLVSFSHGLWPHFPLWTSHPPTQVEVLKHL